MIQDTASIKKLYSSLSVFILIMLIISINIFFLGCAMYLGYHYEYKEGPKNTREISKLIENPYIEIIEKPTKDKPVVLFRALGNERINYETSYIKETYKCKRYIPYDPVSDVLEPIFGCYCGPFDLLARLFGSPPIFVQVFTGRKDKYGSPEKEPAKWDKVKPNNWYMKNLWGWFGWILPGINACTGRFSYHYENVLLDSETKKETRQGVDFTYLPSEVINLDLGPAGKKTTETDNSGNVQLDLETYLIQLWKDYDWKITAHLEQYPDSKDSELIINTTDIGITWAHPAVNDKKDFEIAQKNNSVEVFQRFMEKHPDGPYSNQAKEILIKLQDKQQFDIALKEDTEEAYTKYSEKFPEGKYSSDAKSKIIELKKSKDEKNFIIASMANTKEAYEEYLKLFPEGIHTTEAKIKIENLQKEKIEKTFKSAKEKAQTTGNLKPLRDFLNDFPNSYKDKEARQIIWELTPKVILTSPNIEDKTVPIKEKPDIFSNEVVRVRVGKELPLVKREENWFYVEWDTNKYGYIHKEYITEQNK